MRKVVYATKADDLRKEMSDYDSTTTSLQQKYNKQSDEYSERIKLEKALIEREVRQAIGETSTMDITIRIGQELFVNSDRDDTDWTVSINVNNSSKWDKDVALSWNYDVKLDDQGNVVKETGSWSGLRATTPAQIEDLKESVRLIEIINNIDWKSILHRTAIRWGDYVDEDNLTALHDRQKTRPDFEKQIAEAEVADYVGTDTWIKLSGSPSSSYGYGNKPYWAMIKKETPARYVIDLVPDQYIDTEGKSYYQIQDVTVNKQNFLNKVVTPVETFK